MNNIDISDLTPYAFEKQSLEQPESWMSWYVPGAVICQTSLGNHYFELEPSEKRHFRYGEAVRFEHLKEWEHMPQAYHEMVDRLTKLSEALAPLELVAVSMEEEYYTLYYDALEIYFILPEPHLQRLSSHTVAGLASLKPTGFADARYLQLAEDGRIVL